jgi:hypothetical protein
LAVGNYWQLADRWAEAVAGYLDEYHVPWRAYGDGWRAEVCLAAGQEVGEMATLIEPPPP